MELYALPTDQNRIPDHPRSVALGIFDGVHIGHRAVITRATDAPYPCAVYTFRPDTVTTKSGQKALCPGEFFGQLDTMGVEELFEVDFSTVQQLTPTQFVQQVLCEQLHAAAVTCGFNYRFGKGGTGDAALLTELCAAHGIPVTVVPAVEVDGMPVSSTAIRQALSQGDMDTVRRLLGRNFCLRLPVSDGQHLGRRLGTPTINQLLPDDTACPRFGVYASCAIANGQVLPAVTNIGRRPTVGCDTPLAETWILGFEGDLYGQTVAVYPLALLREERKFDSLDALKAQVQADGDRVMSLFTAPAQPPIRAILFDFDDTLGPRGAAFRQTVDAFLRRYYPGLEPAEHERRLTEMVRFNNYGYGMPVSYPEFIRRYLTAWEPLPDANPDAAYRQFFRDYARFYTLSEDTVPVLTALRQQGYRLGVITNGDPRVQNQKLDQSGVRPLLDLAIVSGDEGIHKPDAELFRRAAAKLGVPCESCLFVGDHPLNDVSGALSAGMRAVWVDAGFPPEHPCLQHPLPRGVPVIRRLAELSAVPMLSDGAQT